MSRKKYLQNENSFGGRLNHFRNLMGLTSPKFAKMLGISQGSLSEIENNKRKPSSKPIEALIQKTDINIYWLYSGKGSPYKLNAAGDEITYYDEEDAPIAEHTQSMGTSLATKYRDDDPRNIKKEDRADPGEGIPIINKEGQEETQTSGNMGTPDLPLEDPFLRTVTALRTIFDSGDPLLISTIQNNISTFAHAAIQHRQFRKQSELVQKHDEEILKLKKRLEAGDAGVGGDKTGTDR